MTTRPFIAALCLVLAGCGSAATTEPTAQPPAAVEPAEDIDIDACALLGAGDISALLGATVDGESTSTPGGPYGCTWENPDNYESVTVQIGNRDTAINGTLPPMEPGFPEVGSPGPDGMRFLGSGMVEFAAGKRSNTVQVAVLAMSAEQANAAAVDLARKIGPLVPE